MALNCSSPSLFLGDDCSGKMLGCGCWSEEASPLSSCGVGSLWWDELDLELELEDEEEEEEEAEESDPIARLPSDPFEMNLEATSAMAALAWCIEDFTARSGGSDDFFVNLLNHAFIAFAPNPSIDGDIGFSEGSFGSEGPSSGDANQFSWLSSNASCSQTSQFAENASSSECAILECRDVVGAACSGFAANPSSSQDATLAYHDTVGTAPYQPLGRREMMHIQECFLLLAILDCAISSLVKWCASHCVRLFGAICAHGNVSILTHSWARRYVMLIFYG